MTAYFEHKLQNVSKTWTELSILPQRHCHSDTGLKCHCWICPRPEETYEKYESGYPISRLRLEPQDYSNTNQGCQPLYLLHWCIIIVMEILAALTQAVIIWSSVIVKVCVHQLYSHYNYKSTFTVIGNTDVGPVPRYGCIANVLDDFTVSVLKPNFVEKQDLHQYWPGSIW
jgi:hypothetical protein